MEKYTVDMITDEMLTELNLRLTSMGASEIGLNNHSVSRAKDFVEFEQWLEQTELTNIQELVEDYGFIPLLFSLTGIDMTYAILLQGTDTLKLRGYIRYLQYLLEFATEGRAVKINALGKELFGDNFQLSGKREMTQQFISKVLEYFINTHPNQAYTKAVVNLMTLIDE